MHRRNTTAVDDWKRPARAIGLALTLLITSTAGCDDSPTSPSDDLRGGVLLSFDVVGQPFAVWTTNPRTIEQAIALFQSGGRGQFPVGRIRRSAGQGAHNAPYSWHLDPVETELAEAAIELCDGTPQFVEANLDYFVNQVLSYCPWSAVLVRLDDHR